MKFFRQLIIPAIITAAVLLSPTARVPAAAEGISARLTVSTGKPAEGQIITLTVAISAKIDINNYDMVLTYDPGLFQFVSDSEKNLTPALTLFDIEKISPSAIQIVAGAGTQENSLNLCQLKFKAMTVGSAQFVISEICVNEEYPAPVSKSVTVMEAPVLSSVNALASLEIDQGLLAPAFSPDVLAYAVPLPSGTAALSVSAIPKDSKARVTVSGNTALSDGENEILVVVTAEDGSKRTYTIIASLAAPSPTPEATPTPPVTLMLPDGAWTIAEPPSDLVVPVGFVLTLSILDGRTVPVFQALKGSMVLFYLTRETGESGLFYFSSRNQAYLPFYTLDLPSKSFAVLTPEEGDRVPDGFNAAPLELGGRTLPAWKPVAADPKFAGHDMVLLFLLDSRGDKQFYWLDKTTWMIMPYMANSAELPSPSPSETTGTTPDKQDLENAARPFNPWQLAAVLLGLFFLIQTGAVIWLAVMRRREKQPYRGSVRIDPDRPADTSAEPPGHHANQSEPRAPRIRRVD